MLTERQVVLAEQLEDHIDSATHFATKLSRNVIAQPYSEMFDKISTYLGLCTELLEKVFEEIDGEHETQQAYQAEINKVAQRIHKPINFIEVDEKLEDKIENMAFKPKD